MFSIYFMLFLLCFVENGFGLKKQLCSYKDEVCLTEAVKQRTYSMFVEGVPGVEASDPLSLKEIIVNLPECVYKLHEPELIGFRDCQFKKLKLTHKEHDFDYELLCPHLTLQSAYQISKTDTEEKGKTEIIYNDYYIIIRGTYEKIKGDNEKWFVHIIDHTIQLDLQAGATYRYKNSANDGKEKPEGYYKNMEELSRQTVMEAFVNKFADNLKDFVDAIPMEDLHYRYVRS